MLKPPARLPSKHSNDPELTAEEATHRRVATQLPSSLALTPAKGEDFHPRKITHLLLYFSSDARSSEHSYPKKINSRVRCTQKILSQQGPVKYRSCVSTCTRSYLHMQRQKNMVNIGKLEYEVCAYCRQKSLS